MSFTHYQHGKTYVGFQPYRKNDVKVGSGGYQQINLPQLGLVWANASENHPAVRQMVGEDYTVTVLGHGNVPFIPWSDLTPEQQELLLTTL
jgi:hypothetical protein